MTGDVVDALPLRPEVRVPEGLRCNFQPRLVSE